jgi:hypothetical protein
VGVDGPTEGVVEMEHSSWRPSPGTVFGLLALVVAVTGTAFAGPLARTSVLDKKEKKQVRKIAKGQVKKLAAGLAVASAKSASNADKLDGQDASAFSPADEIHSPGRLVLNDPTPGDNGGSSSTMLVVGTFTIAGNCVDDLDGTGSDQANLSVEGPVGSSFTGPHSNGFDFNEEGTGFGSAAAVTDMGNQVEGGHIVAVAPNGQVVSISGSAEVGDPAGDCVFGVTAIGP